MIKKMDAKLKRRMEDDGENRKQQVNLTNLTSNPNKIPIYNY